MTHDELHPSTLEFAQRHLANADNAHSKLIAARTIVEGRIVTPGEVDAEAMRVDAQKDLAHISGVRAEDVLDAAAQRHLPTPTQP